MGLTTEPTKKSDNERLAKLRHAIMVGREQIAAGQGIDGETVFAQLRAEFVDAVHENGDT